MEPKNDKIAENLKEYIEEHRETILPSSEVSNEIRKNILPGSCFLIYSATGCGSYKGYNYFDLIYLSRDGNLRKVNLDYTKIMTEVKSFKERFEKDREKWQYLPDGEKQIKKELEGLGLTLNIITTGRDRLIGLVEQYNQKIEENRREEIRANFNL